MTKVQLHHSLKKFNTFGIEAYAERFHKLNSENDLLNYFNISEKTEPVLVLGEGSNILFTEDFRGTVIHPAIRGISVARKDEKHIYINVNAGENWDEFVRYCVNNHWSGIENLSNIPGSVGACPVQNIGAYGVEVKDRIEKVIAYHLSSGKRKIFSNKECKFGYRSSIFKSTYKHQYIIIQVQFRLDLKFQPVLNYGHLELEVKKQGEINLQNLRDAVIAIRNARLPDVNKLGNAGSFFKNPVVKLSEFNRLRDIFGEFPYYITEPEKYKIPAAWMIEQCGFKAMPDKNVSVYKNQPLVIVNTGNATGKEIMDYAKKIMNAVSKRFSIELEPEVNII